MKKLMVLSGSLILLGMLFSGCAGLLARYGSPAESGSPKSDRAAEPRDLEGYLSVGTAQEVVIPRGLLEEWLRAEKQRSAECRIAQEQLQAFKAMDMEKWNHGKPQEKSATRRR